MTPTSTVAIVLVCAPYVIVLALVLFIRKLLRVCIDPNPADTLTPPETPPETYRNTPSTVPTLPLPPIVGSGEHHSCPACKISNSPKTRHKGYEVVPSLQLKGLTETRKLYPAGTGDEAGPVTTAWLRDDHLWQACLRCGFVWRSLPSYLDTSNVK